MPIRFLKLHDKEWLTRTYETKTTWQIAEELGCCQSAVHAAMKRHGVLLRAPRRAYKTQALRDKSWLAEQYEQFTTHEIAKMVGCGQITVWRWMRKHEIPLRKEHVNRRRTSEYVQMLHPETGRLIKEHRYLMEQYLGRKLQPNESVHHIDGIKDNNDLSNLVVLVKSAHHSLHMKAIWKKRKSLAFSMAE